MCNSSENSFSKGLAAGVAICFMLMLAECGQKIDQERFMREQVAICLHKEQMK